MCQPPVCTQNGVSPAFPSRLPPACCRPSRIASKLLRSSSRPASHHTARPRPPRLAAACAPTPHAHPSACPRQHGKRCQAWPPCMCKLTPRLGRFRGEAAGCYCTCIGLPPARSGGRQGGVPRVACLAHLHALRLLPQRWQTHLDRLSLRRRARVRGSHNCAGGRQAVCCLHPGQLRALDRTYRALKGCSVGSRACEHARWARQARTLPAPRAPCLLQMKTALALVAMCLAAIALGTRGQRPAAHCGRRPPSPPPPMALAAVTCTDLPKAQPAP